MNVISDNNNDNDNNNNDDEFEKSDDFVDFIISSILIAQCHQFTHTINYHKVSF
jgi:hypothetical protein